MGAVRLLPGVGFLVAALALLTGAPAAAQTFSISVNTAPNMGNVVAASSGVTTFNFSSAGAVTKLSGSGLRSTGGTVRGVLQISCTGQGSVCNGAVAKVRIGAIGSPGGKAGALSNFTVLMGSGGTMANVTGTNPVEFTVTQQNRNSNPIVYFGADIAFNGNDGAGAPGPATSGFYAYIAKSPTTPTTGVSDSLTAVVSRPISVTGSPTLVFGTIMKPSNGAGSVTLNPSTNTRVVAGNGAGGMGNPTPQRASYTVTGEGGQAISVSVPARFAMSGPGQAIDVTLTNAGLPAALSNMPGSEGTASFFVGGGFNTQSDMTVGDYSGVYSVTAQYN